MSLIQVLKSYHEVLVQLGVLQTLIKTVECGHSDAQIAHLNKM